MPNVVEVRCPVGPQKLFTKLKLGETTARYIQPDNVIEIACSDCRKLVRNRRGDEVVHVLHRYNFLGELIETLVVGADGQEEVLPTL